MTNYTQDSPPARGNGAKRDPITRARKRAGAGLMESTVPRPIKGERELPGMPAPEPEPAEDYKQAERDSLAQTRREIVASVRNARRKLDRARERERKLSGQFVALVALVASTKPERPDWYEYPGSLSRKEVAEASGLAPVQMQRLMERYRETRKPARKRAR